MVRVQGAAQTVSRNHREDKVKTQASREQGRPREWHSEVRPQQPGSNNRPGRTLTWVRIRGLVWPHRMTVKNKTCIHDRYRAQAARWRSSPLPCLRKFMERYADSHLALLRAGVSPVHQLSQQALLDALCILSASYLEKQLFMIQ